MERINFTRKQINVIYGASKRGDLKVRKGFFTYFYFLVESHNAYYDPYEDMPKENKAIRSILDSIFAGKIAKAQKAIDSYCEANAENLACYER